MWEEKIIAHVTISDLDKQVAQGREWVVSYRWYWLIINRIGCKFLQEANLVRPGGKLRQQGGRLVLFLKNDTRYSAGGACYACVKAINSLGDCPVTFLKLLKKAEREAKPAFSPMASSVSSLDNPEAINSCA